MGNRNNEAHRKAWMHFYPEGEGKAREGYVLHHVDTTLIQMDPERYDEWRPEDLAMITTEEHSRLHATGRASSEEKRRKIGEAQTGEGNSFHGRTHTDETKRRMSEARKAQGNFRKGTRQSEETRRRISEAIRRWHQSR